MGKNLPSKTGQAAINCASRVFKLLQEVQTEPERSPALNETSVYVSTSPYHTGKCYQLYSQTCRHSAPVTRQPMLSVLGCYEAWHHSKLKLRGDELNYSQLNYHNSYLQLPICTTVDVHSRR